MVIRIIPTLGFRRENQKVVVSPLAMLKEGQAVAFGRLEG